MRFRVGFTNDWRICWLIEILYDVFRLCEQCRIDILHILRAPLARGQATNMQLTEAKRLLCPAPSMLTNLPCAMVPASFFPCGGGHVCCVCKRTEGNGPVADSKRAEGNVGLRQASQTQPQKRSRVCLECRLLIFVGFVAASQLTEPSSTYHRKVVSKVSSP